MFFKLNQIMIPYDETIFDRICGITEGSELRPQFKVKDNSHIFIFIFICFMSMD